MSFYIDMANNRNFSFEMSGTSQASTLRSSSLFDADYSDPSTSPIDQYLDNKTSYLKLIGCHLINSNNNNKFYSLAQTRSPEWQKLSNLLILGFVSSVESYCRAIIRRVLLIDDRARKNSYSSQLSYGAALHHNRDLLPEALLERVSFTSAEEIFEKIKSYLGIGLAAEKQSNTKLNDAMVNYNIICELRHCVVHRAGLLGSNNAMKLGMDDHSSFLEKPIYLDITAVQNIALIGESVVRELNNALFAKLLSRTVQDENWEGSFQEDSEVFCKYYDLFISREKKCDTHMAACYDSFANSHGLLNQRNSR